MNIAGGPSGVVTEHDIQQRRSVAMRLTPNSCAKRASATDLDNQLMRAELAAARVFGTRPGVDYDLGADLPALRREVDMLDEAGVRSPAAMYATRDADLELLDKLTAAAVTEIAGSAQTVQPLHLAPTPTSPRSSAPSPRPHYAMSTASWPSPPAGMPKPMRHNIATPTPPPTPNKRSSVSTTGNGNCPPAP
ncbi:hypothetical protein BN970_06866 [Mycolicibacterium conceptionense]|uniref:Uncharacterized protein n=1 Tax=Mycolicibacterium conceptionense TaxID=451644 RepID=A0A0U1E0K1_9MYCO|nr:hypothetical protein BN970_06866 [Mycolicibacterium conceptionense]